MKSPSIALLSCLLALVSCASNEDPFSDHNRRQNQIANSIDRKSNEVLFSIVEPHWKSKPQYPWDDTNAALIKISKEHFRCRGSELNPMRVKKNRDGSLLYLHDCGGSDRHSLPLREGKEFVYPILIDLLNHIQNKTGKAVVITSGHRCPTHHTYCEEGSNNSSRHMIGATVAFYVQGMEEQTQAIVQLLQDYYRITERYAGQKEYEVFKRDDSPKQPSATPAWLNKEIALRVYGRTEGRDFDTRHPYPYLTITVRHDRDLNTAVKYSWDQAQNNYQRW